MLTEFGIKGVCRALVATADSAVAKEIDRCIDNLGGITPNWLGCNPPEGCTPECKLGGWGAGYCPIREAHEKAISHVRGAVVALVDLRNEFLEWGGHPPED
jgi:hypothetical protein